MNRKFKIASIIFSAILMVSFAQLPSIAVSAQSKNQVSAVTTLCKPMTKITAEATTNKSQVVYWVDGTKIYHFSKGCRTLSKSKKIHSGTVKQAIAAGHTKACKVCG